MFVIREANKEGEKNKREWKGNNRQENFRFCHFDKCICPKGQTMSEKCFGCCVVFYLLTLYEFLF